MVTNYNRWLREDAVVPKLYIDAEPGFFSQGIRRTISSWPNVRKVKAKGLHFLQEDDPDTIGKAVAEFVQSMNNLFIFALDCTSYKVIISIKCQDSGIVLKFFN